MFDANEIMKSKKTYKNSLITPLKDAQWYELYRVGIPLEAIEDNQQFYTDCKNNPDIFGDLDVDKTNKPFSKSQKKFFKTHQVLNYENLSFADAQYLIKEVLNQLGQKHWLQIQDNTTKQWAKGKQKQRHKAPLNDRGDVSKVETIQSAPSGESPLQKPNNDVSEIKIKSTKLFPGDYEPNADDVLNYFVSKGV